MISAAVGARYVSAKNTYKGYIKMSRLMLLSSYGGTQTPGDYLRTMRIPGFPCTNAAQLSGTASYLTS